MNTPAPTLGEEIASSDVVLDVSISCAWDFADEASEEAWAVLERLQAGRAHVPAIWLWETANVLVQAERRRRITPAAIRAFLGLLEALPISSDPPSTGTAWHDTLALARSHRLTACDAAYLELALCKGLPLATRDKALQEAARLEGGLLLCRAGTCPRALAAASMRLRRRTVSRAGLREALGGPWPGQCRSADRHHLVSSHPWLRFR